MKMSRYVFVIVAVCLLPSLMFAASDAAKGKSVYAAKCQSCHGVDGTPPASIMKAFPTIKPLSDPKIQAMSDAEWTKVVRDGIGKMKKVTGLNGSDLGDVVEAAKVKSHSNVNNNRQEKKP